MADLPTSIEIVEEGPREGFQIEKGPISTADKVALIDALSQCGFREIQAASFVSLKHVPGWADAEAVVTGFIAKPAISYSALWFNAAGMQRALAFRDKLTLEGSIALTASEAFTRKNLNRDRPGQIAAMREHVAAHKAAGVPVTRLTVMAAFGCNYQGDVPSSAVVEAVSDGLTIANEAGLTLKKVSIADSMGWATPQRIGRVIGALRETWPDLPISLHLHDTRGLGIASAYEGLRLGVRSFDAAVAGLGGCPFAGHPGAPGNIATEELVLMCHEMGIATGIDLDALLEAGRLAERIVGRQLPSAALRSGTIDSFRKRAA